MHLQRIKFGEFKNLNGVEITFSEFFEGREGDKQTITIKRRVMTRILNTNLAALDGGCSVSVSRRCSGINFK